MARDYAKGNRSRATTNRGGRSTRSSNPQAGRSGGNGWRLYGAGVVTGVFLSLLLYLVTLPPGPGEIPSANAVASAAEAAQEPPKPRFDFYTMLPEQTMDVEVEPAATAQPRSAAVTEWYLLQAGSFKQRDDADRRRAELLLLGLEPKIEESDGDNGRWFRVFVGPYESRGKMAKARSLTTAQNIDTLVLKRNKP